MNIVIVTTKSWNVIQANKIRDKFYGQHQIDVITNREDVNCTYISKISPDFVFFPHWSYIIPKDVYEKYNCVVFHMTDLPFGRGGSPLQNLIVREIEKTKISAIKVVGELDAGPIYMKEDLELSGSATEIYKRAAEIIFGKMIPKFLDDTLIPYEQEGEIVAFKRRKPEESEIQGGFNEKQIYDYIRMLDAEGYPNAFINYGDYRLEFTDAEYNADSVQARVVFRRKLDE